MRTVNIIYWTADSCHDNRGYVGGGARELYVAVLAFVHRWSIERQHCALFASQLRSSGWRDGCRFGDTPCESNR